MIKKELLWQKSMDSFAPTCHQKSERSFFLCGWQMPICARCTGLYLGYVIGIVLLLVPLYLPVWLCGVGIMAMFLDWYIQFKNIRMSTNIRRFLSGLCAGIAIVQILAYGWRMLT